MSLGWDCPEDIVSFGVLEEVSSLRVFFRLKVSVSNKLPLFSVWVPVVTWHSIGIVVSSPEISSTSTILVAWDRMADLVSCAVPAEVAFLTLQCMVGTLGAVICAGSVMVFGQSPPAGAASVDPRVWSALVSPDTGSVGMSSLQNRAASSSDISTYPSKCH